MEFKNITQATLVVALCAGCAATTQVPRDRITSAEAAVRTADQLRSMAPVPPAADHHLKLAREQLAAGHREIKDGNDRRAEMLFIRARTDAELAQQLSMAAKAESEKNEMQTELDKLKSAQPAPSQGVSVNVAPGTEVEIEHKETLTIEEKRAEADEATPSIPSDAQAELDADDEQDADE